MASPDERPARRRVFGVVLMIACTCGALAAAEIVTRLIDGYRLVPLRLGVPRTRVNSTDPGRVADSRKWQGDTDALPYVATLPVATGVQREWFAARLPGRRNWQADAELEARAKRYQPVDLPANYEWNWNYVFGAVCRGEHGEDSELFKHFDDLYVFEPLDGSDAPRFRFLRNATYQSGLQTNSFGWRGPEIPLNKNPQTIRLAFIGASTTVGMHAESYSYPELVNNWLNQWAGVHHLGVSFDAINAGREGVNSSSIQAIVKQELSPVEPDLVVYYEGANQFWPIDYLSTTLPPRSRVSGPQAGTLVSYSATARRVVNAVRGELKPGSEPPKPRLALQWPPDLDEHDPDLTNPHLPYETQHVLADLDRIRHSLDDDGSRLAIASFVWLVHPGLVLDPVRDALVFSYLNTTFWPFTYAHMRRFLDFQTRVFRKYAASHDLDFVDLAELYPQDARLFGDAVHMTTAGIRLQAWIVFNRLVPIIERRMVSREWPRPVRHPLPEHPAFAERRLVPIAQVRAACGNPGPSKHE